MFRLIRREDFNWDRVNKFKLVIFAAGVVIVADINQMGSFCNRLVFSFIKREGNAVANSLAKFSRTINDVVVWMEDPPEWLDKFLSFDSSQV